MASLRAARKPRKRQQKHANSSSASPPSPPQSVSWNAPPEEGGNVDRVLYRNLVDMVPLVESLMDRKPNPSFRRRASLVYTPTPSNPRNVVDRNGRMTAQTNSAKKPSDRGDNIPNKELDNLDGVSDFSSSSALTAEDVQKNTEELTMLREQLDTLRRNLVEKDEALKSLKDSLNEMLVVNATINELKQQVVEKDFLIINANLQLTNTEIKLEERQAALEKLELEVAESNSKIEELQGVLDSTNFEIFAFMKLFDELSKICSDTSRYDNCTFQPMDQLPCINIDENDVQKMEEARIAYVAAVAAAKENPSEESLAAAAEARIQLQACLLNCH